MNYKMLSLISFGYICNTYETDKIIMENDQPLKKAVQKAETKKAETKNQHYVPQFYQRYFSHDGKNIGTYVIVNDKNIPSAPIRHQASKEYFYSDNMNIEKALGGIEGIAKTVIDKVITNDNKVLSKEEAYSLYCFTMMQVGRTPSQVRIISDALTALCRTLIKKEVEIKRNNGEHSEVEGITDEIIQQLEVNFAKPGMFAVGTQAQLINTCIDLKCKFLINKTKIPFITCDNPAVIYNQFLIRMKQQSYALGSRGLQIYLPITPTFAVMYYDSECYKIGCKKRNYIDITQVSDVLELNKLSAVNAENVIYYMKDSISDYELQLLARYNKKYNPHISAEMYPEILLSEKEEIIGVHNNPIQCKLNFSFVRELTNYRMLNVQDFKPSKHLYRDIAYYKDEIVKHSFNIRKK